MVVESSGNITLNLEFLWKKVFHKSGRPRLEPQTFQFGSQSSTPIPKWLLGNTWIISAYEGQTLLEKKIKFRMGCPGFDPWSSQLWDRCSTTLPQQLVGFYLQNLGYEWQITQIRSVAHEINVKFSEEFNGICFRLIWDMFYIGKLQSFLLKIDKTQKSYGNNL